MNRRNQTPRSAGISKRSALAVLVTLTILVASLALYPQQLTADDFPLFETPSPPPSPSDEYVPDQLIVKFKNRIPSAAAENLNESLGTKAIYTSPFAGFKVLRVPKGKTVPEMVELYSKQSIVEYAEPNYIDHIAWSPNDPYYSYQWHFYQINLEAAWDLDTIPPDYGGDPSIVVAILDSGVAYETYGDYVQAPDLASTTFISGYDFVNDDAHPNDDSNHGTHVCGTIAQSTNNGLGLAGIAFNTAIMPVKVFNSTGGGSHSLMAEGFYYATDHGVHIINYSASGAHSITKENAVAYAYNHGVTIIAAAGNEYETGNDPQYPAAYDDYCIAVGATRFDQTRAPYSNTGSYLDIVAPGGDYIDQNGDGYIDGVLQQTFAEGDPTDFGYFFKVGTSMACPHVAGVAALILAKNPGLTPDQVREALESTATDLGTPGRDDMYGWGLLNAQAAVSWTPIEVPTVTTNAATLVEETTATLNGVVSDDGGEACEYRFQYGTSPSVYGTNTTWTGNKTTGQSFNESISSLNKGTKYYFRAQARNSAGTASGSEQIFLTKPDAPSSFDASTVNSTQIDLSWAKGDGAQQTKIQRKQGSYPIDRNNGTQVYFDTGTSTSDTGLNASTTYYYRAWSYVSGSEQWSDDYAEDSATTTSGITPPTVNTTAASLVEETTATLNGVVSDDGGEACEYRFQYGTSPSVYGTNTTWTGNKTTGQSFSESISSLSKGTKYYFRAQARNSAGTGSGSEQTFLTKPDAPSSFDASTVNSTQIDLSWTKGDGAQQTKIQRKQGSYPIDRNDGTQVYFGTETGTSDTGLNASTTYYYRAWSYVSGSEQWSDGYAEDWAMTESPPNNPPDAPSNPSPIDHATGVSINANLGWTGGDPDTGDTVTYDVYFGTNSTPPLAETIGPYAANQTSLSYEPGTSGYNTTYYWQIVARDSYNSTTEGPVWEFTTGLPVTTYNITLAADWNLVSLPLIPDNTEIATVTAGISDSLSFIYYYNVTGTWPVYSPGNPASSLTSMEDGFGYWFFMNSPATLEISGQEMPDPPTLTPAYDVFDGYNLIGFTSTTSMSPESYLASIDSNYDHIYGYDAEGQTFLMYSPGNPASTLTIMEPGDGFWLRATAEGTIVPPT
jgi:serine protease